MTTMPSAGSHGLVAIRHTAAMAAVLVALSGCGGLPPTSFADGRPEMLPEAFFAGETESTGILENRSGQPMQRFRVHGEGQRLADGTFSLRQRIDFEGEATTERTWSLTKLDDHRYAGALTDAAGPVAAEAYGNLFHLTYPMRQPPLGRMEQWLYLQPDGRTALNEATITLLGIVVAHLSERISRIR